MKGWLRHPVRVTVRLVWLAAEMSLGALRFLFQLRGQPDGPSPARSLWLQRTARRVARVLHLKTSISGPIPSSGLLVCNHLGYLDIVMLAATTPAVFVAKTDVRGWPFFGWCARKSGTIFVNRTKSTLAPQTNDEIAAALDKGALVVLFPEGTSSGGAAVLPFKSTLLEPASRREHPLFAGLIHYALDDGDVAEEVCYWGDMTFPPHMINLLSKREIRASVHFTRVHGASSDRKELARQLHLEISLLHGSVQLQRGELAGKKS